MRRSAAVFAVLVALAAGTAQGTDLGVNIEFWGDRQPSTEALLLAGIRWVRTDLAWSAAETAPGRFDFTLWDRMVERYRNAGVRTLLILDYNNGLYEGGFPPASPEGRAAFAGFAQAAARFFRGRVAWEIWNEPNIPAYWAGAPDAGAYVELARQAAEAIRREDPGAWILGPALGGGRFDVEYLQRAFQLGLLDVVDAVSVHPYGADEPETAVGFYRTVRGMMSRVGRGRILPIVVSEWGYPVEGHGLEGQADYLTRCLAVNEAAGIPLTIWFNWQEPVLPWNSFGLLDLRGRPKPAYAALARAAAGRNEPRAAKTPAPRPGH